MKILLTILSVTVFFGEIFPQNVGINADGAAPHQSALLDVDVSAIPGTKKGFLPPRVITLERDAIINPALGLMIYNIDTKCIDVFDGSLWRSYCPEQVSPDCPSGMVDFEYFSIEQNPHTATDFFSAVSVCHSLGSRMRLPRVGEWYVACSSGLVPSMSSDDEWVDDSTFENNFLTMGFGGWCDGTWNQYFGSSRAFRCVCDQ